MFAYCCLPFVYLLSFGFVLFLLDVFFQRYVEATSFAWINSLNDKASPQEGVLQKQMSCGLRVKVGDSNFPYHILQITIFKLEKRSAAQPTAEQQTVFYSLHSNTFFHIFFSQHRRNGILEQTYLYFFKFSKFHKCVTMFYTLCGAWK